MAIDTEKISKEYMTEFEKLTNKFNSSGIKDTVEKINEAIKRSDIQEINECYSTISDWNMKVANIEGARKAIDLQYRFLRLPSVSAYIIIFDDIEKVWKFNTDN
ncbi:MAG: hypothetical protein QM660_00215 [Dysgonomonas sp.]